MRLRFGDVTFDRGRRLLFRGAEAVHLSPKAYQLLDLLLSRRPEAVSKADIQEALWPRTFVSETNLPALINEVRQALGQPGRHAAPVRTVHGFGYAFDGSVSEEPEPAPSAGGDCRHLLVWGAQALPLPQGQSVVGRERSASLWIGHPSVSREHARIAVAGRAAVFEDLGSKNGSYLRGRKVEGQVPLADGDELRVGCVVLVYRLELVDTSTESAV